MTLKELKSRFTPGSSFTCIENTVNPKWNGQRRVVLDQRKSYIRWSASATWGKCVISGMEARMLIEGKTDFPRKRDIVKITDTFVTFRPLPDSAPHHVVTLEIPPAPRPESYFPPCAA